MRKIVVSVLLITGVVAAFFLISRGRFLKPKASETMPQFAFLAPTTVQPGAEFDVYVTYAPNQKPFNAFVLGFTYSPAQLELISQISPSSLQWQAAGANITTASATNTNGIIRIDAAKLEAPFPAGSTFQNLLKLRFRPKAGYTGPTQLAWTNVTTTDQGIGTLSPYGVTVGPGNTTVTAPPVSQQPPSQPQATIQTTLRAITPSEVLVSFSPRITSGTATLFSADIVASHSTDVQFDGGPGQPKVGGVNARIDAVIYDPATRTIRIAAGALTPTSVINVSLVPAVSPPKTVVPNGLTTLLTQSKVYAMVNNQPVNILPPKITDTPYTVNFTATTPSISPSISPSVPPSPSISPSQPPGTPILDYTVRLEGVGPGGNLSPVMTSFPLKVSIKGKNQDAAKEYTSTALWQGNGIWKGSVTLTGMSTNTTDRYSITIKGPLHLAKRFCVLSASDEQSAPCTEPQIILAPRIVASYTGKADSLDPGDLPEQDGVLNVMDIPKVLSNLLKADNEARATADLNYDGVVNASDWQLLLQSMQKRYDDEIL